MPDSKISGLTSATTPLAGTEVLPIVQSGQTRQVSVANLTAGRAMSAGLITSTGGLVAPGVLTNFADPSGWTTGTGTATGYFGGNFTANGTVAAEDTRQYSSTPVVSPGLVWSATSSDTASDAEGGWNKTITGLVDSKTYRSVVWVRRVTASTSGTFYHGCSASTTLNLNGTTNTNPYFGTASISGLVQDRWYLSVGYIHANADASVTSYGGLYDSTTGAKVVNYTDFKLSSGATSQVHRTFLYYSVDTTTQLDLWGPRFEEVTGNEPSVYSMLLSSSNNVATATALQNTRTLWGQNFNGTANVTGALTSVGNITGTAGVTLTATAGTLGLVATGANVITASTNGSERMRIDSSGNVGIGTSSPGQLLVASSGTNTVIQSVSTNTATSGRFRATNADGNNFDILMNGSTTATNPSCALISVPLTTTPLLFYMSGVERMRLNSVGFGIGTNNPAALLHVSGAGTTQAILTSSDQTTTYLRLINTTHNGGYVGYTSDNLVFLTGATERMRVDTSGNVGIGTSSPSVALQVNGTSNGATLELLRLSNTGTGANTKARLNFYAASTNYGSITGGYGASAPEMVFDINTTAGAYIWNNNATEQMRINASGNVGIGTASPNYRLDVYKAGAASVSAARSNSQAVLRAEVGACVADLNVVSTYGEVRTATNHPLLFSTNLTERMRIDTSGNVGIGTSSPSGKLHVYGGAIRTNTRVTNSQNYPLGHYSPGECVFEIDPTWTEAELQAFFNSSAVTWAAVADAPGGYCIYIDGAVNVGGVYNSGFSYIPVDTSDVYYMECWIQNVGSNQGHYMGSVDYNQSFSSLGGNPGSYGYWVMSNTDPGTTWTKVSGYIQGFGTAVSQFVAGTKYWTPMALFNYTAGTGTRACRISGWKVIRAYQPGNRFFSGNVGIGTTSPTVKLEVYDGTTGELRVTNATQGFQIYTQTGATTLGTYTNIPLILRTNATERMRIDTSGNVGIGTSSPGTRLEVNGRIAASSSADVNLAFVLNNTASGGREWQLIGSATGGLDGGGTFNLRDNTAGANRLTVDSSGNLGLGVTPSAWDTVTAIQVRNGSFYGYSTDESGWQQNAYYASGWKYISTGYAASQYMQVSGQHRWYTAPSGTAGNAISFTQAMTLDASGNLGVGTSSPNTRLEVSGAEAIVSLRVNTANSGISASNYSEIQLSDLGAVRAFWRNLRDGSGKTAFAYNNHLAFLSDGGGTPTERMRITSTGDVGIGTGSPAAKLQVTATGGVYNAAVSIATDIGGGVLVQSTSSGTNSRVGLFLQGSDQIGAAIASAREDTGATWKTYLSFYTNNITGGNVLYLQEKMRITSAGDVGIGTSSPAAKLDVVGSLGIRVNEDGAGTKVIQIRSNYAGLGPSIQVSTADPLLFLTNNTERLRITSAGNIHTPAGATTMTDGFIYIPSAGGTPTGAATAITGTVPLYYDTTNNKLFVYNSSWQNVATAGSLPLVATNANGVVYLNSSSQATTSTALQFNGTELGIGQAASAGIQVDVTTTALAQIRARATTNGVDSRLVSDSSGLLGYTGTISNHAFAFYTNNTERARITATGALQLSPTGGEGGELNLLNPAGGTVGGYVDVSVANNFRLWTGNLNATMQIGQLSSTGGNIQFFTEASEKMRLTSAGVLGIGTSSPGGSGVHVSKDIAGAHFYASGSVSGANVSYLVSNTNAAADSHTGYSFWNNTTLTSPASINFYSSSAIGAHLPNELRIYNHSGSIVFRTGSSATQKFRVNASGEALVVNASGLGYGTGAGNSVTQTTSRTTGVTCNNPCGAITLVSAAGTTTWTSFTVTNSVVAATDTIIVSQKTGTNLYEIHITAVSAGSFRISFRTTGGTTTEQPVFNFAVIKAVIT